MKKLFCCIILAFFLTACIPPVYWGVNLGITAASLAVDEVKKAQVDEKNSPDSGGSSQESTAEKPIETLIDSSKPYRGYLVNAVSASSVSSSGNRCGTLTSTLYVQGSVITGVGRSSWGDPFEVSGSVDSNGQLKITTASAKKVYGTFTGVLSGDSGNGIWQDQTQCYGTWTASKQKQVEPIEKQLESDIETKLINLKQLLDKGLINQEDYNRKKAELLDQL
jgi:hypothetical protein